MTGVSVPDDFDSWGCVVSFVEDLRFDEVFESDLRFDERAIAVLLSRWAKSGDCVWISDV